MFRLFILIAALAFAGFAVAVDREEAIETAKRYVKNKCVEPTQCRFSAKLDSNKWYVTVEYPGGRQIFIVDQAGKVVGHMERK